MRPQFIVAIGILAWIISGVLMFAIATKRPLPVLSTSPAAEFGLFAVFAFLAFVAFCTAGEPPPRLRVAPSTALGGPSGVLLCTAGEPPP